METMLPAATMEMPGVGMSTNQPNNIGNTVASAAPVVLAAAPAQTATETTFESTDG